MSARTLLAASVCCFTEVFLGFGAHAAPSPEVCIEEFAARKGNDNAAAGIAPSEAELLIANVANKIGLFAHISVVDCDTDGKAFAWEPPNGSKSPPGLYVIYNPDWVQNVIGHDQVLAAALFGHELGHFLNFHFGVNRNLPRVEKELQADKFAGCAVARLYPDYGWAKLPDLLERIRPAVETSYPSRSKSLEIAREGFEICGGKVSRDNPHEGWVAIGKPNVGPEKVNFDGATEALNLDPSAMGRIISARTDVYLRSNTELTTSGNNPSLDVIKQKDCVEVLAPPEMHRGQVWARVRRTSC